MFEKIPKNVTKYSGKFEILFIFITFYKTYKIMEKTLTE